jgi:hypothetical protein
MCMVLGKLFDNMHVPNSLGIVKHNAPMCTHSRPILHSRQVCANDLEESWHSDKWAFNLVQSFRKIRMNYQYYENAEHAFYENLRRPSIYIYIYIYIYIDIYLYIHGSTLRPIKCHTETNQVTH